MNSTKSISRRDALKLAGSAMALPVMGVQAQSYPGKPVQVLVGFAAGGPLDVVTRLLAKELTTDLGQAFTVENRTGASGQLATDAVAKAPRDGHTLLSTASTFIVNPLLITRKQPDPLKDFVAVSLVARLPTVLVVAKSSPARNVQDLIAMARKQGVTYSSAGNGGPGHLAGALLGQVSKTPMTHVPFRGAAPALMEVISGRIDYTFYTMTGLKEQVDAGTLRPLAITAPERHHLFPQVPTMTEAGIPGFEHVGAWFGIVAPEGTPAEAVNTLSQTIAKALNRPMVRERLDGLGVVPVGSTPAAFKTFLEQDSSRWTELIREAGIKAE